MDSISYVIKQLERYCKAGGIGRKLVVVPSKQVGYNLMTALAREGVPWVNVHIETPLSLAEWYGGPHLVDRGRRLSSDASLFLFQALLSAALDPAQAKDDFRRSLAVSPGLVRAIQRTVTDLRMADVSPSRVLRSGTDPAKAQLIAEVFAAFEERLRQESLYDSADIYRVAASRIEGPSRFDSVAILDETQLPPLAFSFLERVAAHATTFVRVGRPAFQVEAPSQSVAARFSSVPLVETKSIRVHPAGQIRERRLTKDDVRLVRLRDAVGVEAEVRGVFREIRQLGVPLDSVEIVYTRSDPYLGLISNAAAELDIPIDFSEGVPIRLSRPGQAIIGFYRWVSEGLDARILVNLLRSRLIRFPAAEQGSQQASRTEVAEILEVRKATRGRKEYESALERHRLQIEADEAAGFGYDTDRRVRAVAAGQRALAHLLDLLPDTDTSSLSVLARAGVRFMKEYFRPAGESEAQARESVLDRLKSLEDVKDLGPCTALSALMRDLLSGHRYAASVAREGRIYAVPIERAGYSCRTITFIVGLDEGSFPGTSIESPILLDEDRANISRELEEARSLPAIRTWHLLRMMGTLQGPVTLVANRFDIVDGRERYASSVYAQCREDLDLDAPARYDVACELSEAISESDVWLAQRRCRDYLATAALRYPMLAAGRYAALWRERAEITRFDGYLGGPTPELSLRGAVVSASRLERLADCPHKYFLQHVLKVRPPDEIDPEDNRWLDPPEFGKLVHSLLFEFMSRLSERSERPGMQHLDEILALAEKMAEDARTRIPPETELAFRAGLRRLKATAQIFLAAESRNAPDVEPIHFEMGFGEGAPEERHPRAVPIKLGDSVSIALRGSIDRVDRTAKGFNIWDYKTGSSGPFDRLDPFSSNKLQWALYAFAFEKLMEGLPTNLSVSKSGYFFVGDQEHGRRIAYAIPDRALIGKYLEPLFDLVERGGFVHYQKSDRNSSPCRFCDYKSICADERREAADLPAAQEATESLDNILEPLSAWMKHS